MSQVLNLSFFPYSACWKNISSGIAAGISWGHRGCWGMGQAPGKGEGEGMLPECSGLTQGGNWPLCSPWHQVYSSTCPLFSVLAQDALSSPTGAVQTLGRTRTTLSNSSPAEPLRAPAVSPPPPDHTHLHQNTFQGASFVGESSQLEFFNHLGPPARDGTCLILGLWVPAQLLRGKYLLSWSGASACSTHPKHQHVCFCSSFVGGVRVNTQTALDLWGKAFSSVHGHGQQLLIKVQRRTGC